MAPPKLMPRIITQFGIRLTCRHWNEPVTASPINLSETGLCISLPQKLNKGDKLSLEIDLIPNAPPIKTTGTVAWVHKKHPNTYYCGIGLKQLAPEQIQSVQQYTQKGAKALLQFLSEFPLFHALSEQDCENLLRIVTLRQLSIKEVLYYEGDQDDHLEGLFIVESGLLGIYKGAKIEPENKLALVSTGQVFGETTLVTEQPHSATIVAINPSRLIQISKLGFRALSKENPQLGLKIMDIVAQTLAKRLGRTTQLLFSPINYGNNHKL